MASALSVTATTSATKIIVFVAVLMLSCLQKQLVAATSRSIGNVMYSGQSTLYAGYYLSNGPYRLVMENDCNLVMYQKDQVLWMTPTNGLGSNCYAKFTKDARLVVYNEKGSVVFDTGNPANPDKGYVLVLNYDGKLVAYGPELWYSQTN